MNKGLPLGPISNPGEASFKAALYPEDNDYLYYVVEAAGQSNHVFCKTNEEFLAAKKNIRQAWHNNFEERIKNELCNRRYHERLSAHSTAYV